MNVKKSEPVDDFCTIPRWVLHLCPNIGRGVQALLAMLISWLFRVQMCLVGFTPLKHLWPLIGTTSTTGRTVTRMRSCHMDVLLYRCGQCARSRYVQGCAGLKGSQTTTGHMLPNNALFKSTPTRSPTLPIPALSSTTRRSITAAPAWDRHSALPLFSLTPSSTTWHSITAAPAWEDSGLASASLA
jgi:hypothetical protein